MEITHVYYKRDYDFLEKDMILVTNTLSESWSEFGIRVVSFFFNEKDYLLSGTRDTHEIGCWRVKINQSAK